MPGEGGGVWSKRQQKKKKNVAVRGSQVVELKGYRLSGQVAKSALYKFCARAIKVLYLSSLDNILISASCTVAQVPVGGFLAIAMGIFFIVGVSYVFSASLPIGSRGGETKARAWHMASEQSASRAAVDARSEDPSARKGAFPTTVQSTSRYYVNGIVWAATACVHLASALSFP